jgi:outer membrane protein OmpA-like peptidoglycan-associated protein
MKKLLAILLSAVALTSISSSAKAENLTLSVSGGPAMDFRAPGSDVLKRNQFNIGGGGQGDLLFRVVPNLSVGPSASLVVLPQVSPTSPDAVVWTFGGTVRVQGNHNAGWYPFAQITGGISKQSAIYTPGLTSQVGVNFALNEEHNSWLGVFVGYNHSFDTNSGQSQQTLLFNHQDTDIGLAGLSLSFDAPARHRAAVVKTVVQTQVVEKQVAVMIPVLIQRRDLGVALQLPDSVVFDKDSSTVSDAAKTMLTELANKFNGDVGKDYVMTIEGYASSDGDKAHNLALSTARANAVANFLVSNSVDASRLTAVGKGAVGEPNDATNRRVDIVVIRVVKIPSN